MRSAKVSEWLCPPDDLGAEFNLVSEFHQKSAEIAGAHTAALSFIAVDDYTYISCMSWLSLVDQLRERLITQAATSC